MKKEYLKPQVSLVYIGTVVMQSGSGPTEGAPVGGSTNIFGSPRRDSLVDFDDDDDY